jgi:hypothetical protein
MNHSQNNNNEENFMVSDNSKTIVFKPKNKKVMVQDWVNNIQYESKMEDNIYVNIMIDTWKLENLQNNVNNLKFPKIETLNTMTLGQTIAYEAMLVDTLDIIPSNLNLSVEILLHQKIISNNLLYKFKIFE